MTVPWKAEFSVEPELAQALVVEQFPHLQPVALEPLGEGWDNTAFRVNGEFVFRFPRRRLGADCLEAETRVLPRLQSLLPLQIPNPIFVGKPTERFRWLFAGYAMLPGRTACAAALDMQQREAAAAPLGTFLAALHALPPGLIKTLNAPSDFMGRLDLARRVPQAHERVDECLRLNLINDPAPCRAILDDIATASSARPSALVHGDLYVRHILVGSDLLPTGIIDWGDVHTGDVALDLSIAHTFLPPGAYDDFRRVYGPIDDATWRLARFRALSYGLILSIFAHQTNDTDLKREARFILQNLACAL
jgi:aminoglycoside phosphotransferase (APT) family kinase protein